MNPPHLESAYRYCEQLAHSHYENFPVASWLLPANLRRPISVIYAFARTADDFADEGKRSEFERLTLLDSYRSELDKMALGQSSNNPIFIALGDVVTKHKLPPQLFFDLLSAFSQDVTQRRYANFAELLDYCRRSANPVGRLLLHLSNNDSEKNLQHSDDICSALQLINFYQDMAQDFDENDRIYIPEDELQHFGVDESFFAHRSSEAEMRKLFQFQVARAKTMMLRGRPLGGHLKGRFGLEIRFIIEGGLAVIRRLEDCAEQPFTRPRLRRRDWLLALLRAL